MKETLFLKRKKKPGSHNISAEKKHDKKQEKKKEIEKVSQTTMDLTKLTQNEEIPIVVTNICFENFGKFSRKHPWCGPISIKLQDL